MRRNGNRIAPLSKFLYTACVPVSRQPSRCSSSRLAALALLIGTVCWGFGFTWAKAGGDAVERAAGLPPESAFGPIYLLAWRFVVAAVLWLLVFPAARQGWTLRSARRALVLGGLLGSGLIVQHLGLDRTSEAVSAFLTSLTILFVPLLMTVALRKPLRPSLWAGVALATAGVWLMTGATPSGFGLGELLGLACSFVYSLYILAIDAIVPHENPWRMTAGQFLVVAVMCSAVCPLLPHGRPQMTFPAAILAVPAVWINILLLATFSTFVAFGLLTIFQPSVDPARATFIYLFEPVFATVYAAVAVRHVPPALSLAGAGLILIANIAAELVSTRTQGGEAGHPVLVD